MTDYERTTTRETTTTPPVATEPYVTPTAAAPAPVATSVRTTDTAYVASGPGPTTYAARVVTFLFGILQVALILRIVLLLLVANPSGDAAMSAAAGPGKRLGTAPAIAPIARAMYATAPPRTIPATRA